MQKEKSSPEKCAHKNWLFLTQSKGNINGVSECRDCGLWLTHAERLSWETLKNHKFISKKSIILSIIAIIISIASIICK